MSPPDQDFEDLKKIFPPINARELAHRAVKNIEELIKSSSDPDEKNRYQMAIDILRNSNKQKDR